MDSHQMKIMYPDKQFSTHIASNNSSVEPASKLNPKRTASSVTPKNSTFHARAMSKVGSPQDTLDDISVVGSHIETLKKSSLPTNNHSATKAKDSIFRRKAQSLV